MSKIIEIKIPPQLFNIAVTTDNYLIADSNTSDWNTYKEKLPDGVWSIYNTEPIHAQGYNHQYPSIPTTIWRGTIVRLQLNTKAYREKRLNDLLD